MILSIIAFPPEAISCSDFSHGSNSDFKSALSHVDLNVSIAARIDSNSDFKAAVSLSFFKFSPLLILAVTFSSFSFRYSDYGKPCGTRTERGQFATLDAILK